MAWLLALACALGGFGAGLGFVAMVLRRHAGGLARAVRSEDREFDRAAFSTAGARNGTPRARPPEETDADAQTAAALIAHALREPLARLRRAEGLPEDLVLGFERVARQCRLLAAAPRPMKALPTSPVELLQTAAEDIPRLRLGKVATSWTLRARQPVYLDSERARAAFGELLAAASERAGDGSRIAIRIAPAADSRFPVCVEIEGGFERLEPDDLGARVARRILEGEGARLEIKGGIARVFLRSLPPDAPRQIPSNT